MQDIRLTRIERQIASSLTVLMAATTEAESLKDQRLADDLHKVIFETKRILHGIGPRGQSYKPL